MEEEKKKISIAFLGPNRKIIRFEVKDRVVKYFDDMWKDGILIMPLEDPMVKLQVKKMVLSRKSSVSATGLLISDANLGKNKEEYDSCKDDKDIVELIIRDCKLKGLKEIKK